MLLAVTHTITIYVRSLSEFLLASLGPGIAISGMLIAAMIAHPANT